MNSSIGIETNDDDHNIYWLRPACVVTSIHIQCLHLDQVRLLAFNRCVVIGTQSRYADKHIVNIMEMEVYIYKDVDTLPAVINME